MLGGLRKSRDSLALKSYCAELALQLISMCVNHVSSTTVFVTQQKHSENPLGSLVLGVPW